MTIAAFDTENFSGQNLAKESERAISMEQYDLGYQRVPNYSIFAEPRHTGSAQAFSGASASNSNSHGIWQQQTYPS